MSRILRSFAILLAAVFSLPTLVNAAVGYTPGSFKVSGTGAATYSIPIAVPPGAAGIQPSLSLAYSSQSGNGLVGMGFSLQGLSAVTRCPKTLVTDGSAGGVDLTANDRFCLDGQKLILVSGTYGAIGSEYRTELDTLTRISLSSVPSTTYQYFIAKTKSGQTVEYGYFADARVLASGTTTTLIWAANKITDTIGNYLTMRYCNYGATTYCAGSYTGTPGTGEFFPARIDYAGNAAQGIATSSSVVFVYAARTDTSAGYVGGSTVSNSVRLTNITVSEGTSNIRDYRLAYDPTIDPRRPGSQLTSITECDSSLSTAACLAPLILTWSTPTAGIQSYSLGVSNAWGNAGKTFVGDFNGDGAADFASADWQNTNTYYNNVRMKLSKPKFGATSQESFTSETWLDYQMTEWGRAEYIFASDFNGDGITDLVDVCDFCNGTLDYLNTHLSLGGSYFWGENTVSMQRNYKNYYAGDVNADGRMDVIIGGAGTPLNSPNSGTARAIINYSSGIGPGSYDVRSEMASSTYAVTPKGTILGDFNGDSKTDVAIILGSSVNLMLAQGNTFGNVTWATTNAWGDIKSATWAIDVNGDGKADLVSRVSNYFHVELSTGTGFVARTWSDAGTWDAANVWVGDFNADGKADIATRSGATLYIKYSNGNGFDERSYATDGNWNTSGENYVGDFNGDGLPDIASKAGALVYMKAFKAEPRNVITSISNSMGRNISVDYTFSTNNDVYTKYHTASYPIIDVQSPLQIVRSFSTADGVGGQQTVSYTYEGAQVSADGRGFLGFSKVTATNASTGIVTESNYSQTWPYTGMITAAYQKYNGNIIASTVNTLTNYRYGAANAYYYFPYVSQSTASTYELPGGSANLVSTTYTTNTYHSSCATNDAYCDLTSIYVATKKAGSAFAFTKNTVNTYDYTGVPSWILGRLNNAKVSSYIPSSGLTLTRESSFTYNYTTGLLETETVEPNKNTATDKSLTQTTTYQYDGFGNKTSATVSGADGISRTTTYAYEASPPTAPYPYAAGRFQTKVTNALNQTETHEFDARFGTMSKLTGPNGLATTWLYDSFGRKTKETRADGTTTTWTYTLCANNYYCPSGGFVAYAKYYVTQTTSGAPTVDVYYDLLDREVRTRTQGYNGIVIFKDTVYNNLGQVAQVSRPYYVTEITPYWTYFTYDALGRVTSQSLPTQQSSAGTPLASTSYNGLTTTLTQYRDGTALTTTQVKDVMGQLVSVTDANGATAYEYDPFGNLTKVTDPALNVTTMSYDIRGRKLTLTDPDMGYWQYAYNSVGELTRQTDAKGQVIDMTYDSLGRMATRSEPEGLTTWTYDDTTLSGAKAKGKLSKVTWPGGDSRTYTYDLYGRPSTETTTLSGTPFTLTTAYDLYSRLDTVTYPSGFAVRNNYGAYGYVNSVTNAATAFTYWYAPTYKADGQISVFTLGNGLTTVKKINNGTGLIEGISTGVGQGGSATQYLTYQYDTLGNLKQRVDGNQASLTENFSYDNLNRMTNANIPSLSTKTVGYDSLGNITSKSDVGTYTYDPQHTHAVKTAGASSYTYDANGNQLTGPSRTVSYTSFNQPTSITQSGKTNSFTYDGDHQRVMRTEADGTREIYLHPRIDLGAHYEQETHPDGTVEKKNYLYAGKDNIGVYTTRSTGVNDLRYFHKDHLGSIDTITNETGGVVERLSYDAWGKRRSGNWSDATTAISSLTHHGFTGHEMLDDVGLINMNGRIYDPLLGRFLQADPTVQSPGNPQTLNRYSYAGNNPLTYTDPSGYGWGDLNPFKAAEKLWKAVWNSPVARAIGAIAVAYFTAGWANSWYMASSVNAAGGAMAVTGAQFASISVAANIVGGAVGGFFAGAILTGTLKGAALGAISGAGFGGIQGFYGDTWNLSRVASNSFAGGGTNVMWGGSFKDGFKLSLITSMAMYGWEVARTYANKSSLEGGGLHKYNDQGELLTDGTRATVYAPGYSEADNNFITRAGMAREGSGEHWYSESSFVGHFVNNVSKVHDPILSWDYVGGNFVSRSELFNTTYAAINGSTMLPAAIYTAAAMTAGPATTYIVESERVDRRN